MDRRVLYRVFGCSVGAVCSISIDTSISNGPYVGDKRMNNQVAESLAAIAGALLLAGAIAWAGSQNGITLGGLPLFAGAAALAFLVQWVVFLPSYMAQTEHYYDLTGSLTYLTLVIATLLLAGSFDARSVLLTLLVSVWALRLGSFLFLRVKRQGVDQRFDTIKPSFTRFFMAWTLQGLWIFLTLSAVLASMTTTGATELGLTGFVGIAVWAIGFAIEVVSDRQKHLFRQDPANASRFITTGLWAWSRHPNYFGEIVLWLGIALIALPALSGWQYLTLISPLFVYLLLTRVSGIPPLESRAEERWGEDPEFRAYKARTPVLFPRPSR
jgi:steroid 5-alpha reductase family enzyme